VSEAACLIVTRTGLKINQLLKHLTVTLSSRLSPPLKPARRGRSRVCEMLGLTPLDAGGRSRPAVLINLLQKPAVSGLWQILCLQKNRK